MNDQSREQTQVLRGAIVGLGYISTHGHLPAYQERSLKTEDVEIIAICDICPERKSYVPAGIKFYTDFEEMLRHELSRLDFVDISTHAADHYKIAKLALNLGLHVLCEKPLTTTIEEAIDLMKTALFRQRVLFPCHNYQFAPVVQEIRKHLKSGVIGAVKSVTLNTFRNTHALGCAEWKPNWRRHQELSGGGIAMDHGSHSLYLAFEWLGGYPTSVSATSRNFAHSLYDTEDNFSAVFDFDQGQANVHLSWTAGVRKVIYTIQGERGAITVDDDQLQLAVMKNDEMKPGYKASWEVKTYSVDSQWMDSSHTSWFNNLFDKFLLAIKNHDFKNKEIVDAYYSVLSIKKSYESIFNKSEKTSLLIKDPFC